MTPAQLATIKAAIDNDTKTEAANWPLSRERTRLYLALGMAMVAQREAFDACSLAMPGDAYNAAWAAWAEAGDVARAAFAALAPAPGVPDAE